MCPKVLVPRTAHVRYIIPISFLSIYTSPHSHLLSYLQNHPICRKSSSSPHCELRRPYHCSIMAARKMVVSFLVLALIAGPAFAADHAVGGSGVWDSGVDYTTWASGASFAAGDTLTFSYSGLHSVYQVGSKSDYDGCSTSSAVKSDNSGSTKITLDQAGTTYYFVCGTTSHCLGGMKLAVTTAAGSGSPSTPSTPTTPSTPSTPSTPTITTPTTSTKGRSSNAGATTVGKALLGGAMVVGLAWMG